MPYVDVAPVGDEGDGLTTFDRDRSSPGYSLYANLRSCTAQLINAQGEAVHSWQTTECRSWRRVELTANGELIVVGSERKNAGLLMLLSWQSEVLWRRSLSAHHDVELSSPGEISVLTRRVHVVEPIRPDSAIKDSIITVIGLSDGETLAEGSIGEMLGAAPSIYSFEQAAMRSDLTALMDPLHCNSLQRLDSAELAARDPIYTVGNYVVTCRHIDTVAILDWQQQRVVWAWGPGELSGPHEGTVLPNGNILLLDNGLGREFSRVIELDPLRHEIVWEYRASPESAFHTPTRGTAQRLPNGNTLVAESARGRAFEITSDGDIVWEYFNPSRGRRKRELITRIKRYEPAFIEPLLAGW